MMIRMSRSSSKMPTTMPMMMNMVEPPDCEPTLPMLPMTSALDATGSPVAFGEMEDEAWAMAGDGKTWLLATEEELLTNNMEAVVWTDVVASVEASADVCGDDDVIAALTIDVSAKKDRVVTSAIESVVMDDEDVGSADNSASEDASITTAT
jgi:hypothetical protein